MMCSWKISGVVKSQTNPTHTHTLTNCRSFGPLFLGLFLREPPFTDEHVQWVGGGGRRGPLGGAGGSGGAGGRRAFILFVLDVHSEGTVLVASQAPVLGLHVSFQPLLHRVHRLH